MLLHGHQLNHELRGDLLIGGSLWPVHTEN